MSRLRRSTPAASSAHGPEQAGAALAADTSGPDTGPAQWADQLTNRLFGISLDLHHVHGLTRDPRATVRLDHTIEELDHAINDLRHLLQAIPPPSRPNGQPAAEEHLGWVTRPNPPLPASALSRARGGDGPANGSGA